MGKQIKEDDCPKGLPGWLATFGDLMSLLLTFFVLLISFSTVNVQQFNHAMGALSGSLGVLSGEPQLSLPIRKSMPKTEGNLSQAESMSKASQELEEAIEDAGLQGDVKLEETSSGITIRISDKLFFNLAESKLKPEALPLLRKVGDVLSGLSNQINIQGHTDNRPINTEFFASNWELSGMRALSVARYLIQNGKIAPNRISITGYSEYRPLVPNDSEKNMNQNRRVEIHVLHESGMGLRPTELYKTIEDRGVLIEGIGRNLQNP